jgi:hypothetical protein
MQITMTDELVKDVRQIKEFLEGSRKFKFSLKEASIEEKYDFIDGTVDRVGYSLLSKKDKHVVVAYLRKFTGYKSEQLYRLIGRAAGGDLIHKQYHRRNPNHRYSVSDIKLLENTDLVHRRLNSLATKEILRREYEVYGNQEFANIARVSASHINNLRKVENYRSSWENRTKAKPSTIGYTQKPENFGMPGSIRVDTVHQRDVYYLNSVDELTQWEVIVCVPRLTAHYLKQAMSLLLSGFPFRIFNFHSDKGGEFMNQSVALFLTEQLITQTKSRAYHCNDNALVESKNGSVVRKNMGHRLIRKGLAIKVNTFCQEWLTPYLNYHRPCVYVTKIEFSPNGKRKLHYGDPMTPYNKLKRLSKIQKRNFLKNNITFDKLDKIEMLRSDNEFATRLRKAQQKLFAKLGSNPVFDYLNTKL